MLPGSTRSIRGMLPTILAGIPRAVATLEDI